MQLFEKLIEYPEAERLVFESTPRLPVEETPLGEALGLALAGDLTATTDSPPFDNSAVDGYAVRSQDAEAGRVFGVVDEAPAGRPAKRRVGEGEAIKIFTGGVIPEGADAVVMVENTSGWGEEFELKKVPSPGDNIRAAGEDTRKGDVILPAGTEIGAPEIALAATQGYGSLPVYRRPKVVVLSTGTELVEPGTRDLEPGEIFDSNSYAIVAAAREAGAEARRLYAASDDADTLRAAIEEALGDCRRGRDERRGLGRGEGPRQEHDARPRGGAGLLGRQVQARQAPVLRYARRDPPLRPSRQPGLRGGLLRPLRQAGA